MTSSNSNNTLTLDLDSSMSLEYLAEGAANVVYRIRFPSPSPSTSSKLDGNTSPPSETSPLRADPRLPGKLLRLRKDLPFTVPVIDSQKYFDTTVRSLFQPHDLVEQLLFKPSQSLIKHCNDSLRAMEANGSRSKRRQEDYLVEGENYGTLITDMTCAPTDSHAGIEFKPKWLAQSPSAPAGSVRCRTCALRAMKSVRKSGPKTAESLKLGFCPLGLVSNDKDKVAVTADIVLELYSLRENDHDGLRKKLVEFLQNSQLLRRLQKLQEEKDPKGVLDADLSHRNFLTAMTIRDCTLFLKVCTNQLLFNDSFHFRALHRISR